MSGRSRRLKRADGSAQNLSPRMQTIALRWHVPYLAAIVTCWSAPQTCNPWAVVREAMQTYVFASDCSARARDIAMAVLRPCKCESHGRSYSEAALIKLLARLLTHPK